jgi:predicted transcriptional regulator
MARRITLTWIERNGNDINTELQWLGRTIGLFPVRDRSSSRYRIFIELLKAAPSRTPLTSDEIAMRVGLTRGAVVHHLNELVPLNIVLRKSEGYILVDENLWALVKRIKLESKALLDDIAQAAKSIDNQLS